MVDFNKRFQKASKPHSIKNWWKQNRYKICKVVFFIPYWICLFINFVDKKRGNRDRSKPFDPIYAKKILEPKCPILALVSDDNTANQLILHYGVYTKVVNYWNDLDEIMAQSLEEAKKFINLVPGDNIIITGGFSADKNKNEVVPANLMKIETIK